MKKIVIIGGGIAGLTAGILAKKKGFQVEIHEKNALPGGECTGWNRKGFHIDNCIHWLTGTSKDSRIYPLWKEIHAIEDDTEILNPDLFYTSYYQGQKASLYCDLEKTRQELISISPEDTEEINKFIEHVKYAACCEMPVKKPMDKMGLFDMIEMGKLMADMPKVFKEYGKERISDFSKRFKHPLLSTLMKDYLPPEFPTSSFFVSYATIASQNGGIPRGGSLAMSLRIANYYQQIGGKLYLNSPVTKIVIEKGVAGGIILENGNAITADYIISACDTNVLFTKLLEKDYRDRKWKLVYENPKRFPTFTAFQVAFGIDTAYYQHRGTLFFDCEPFQIATQTVSRMSVKSYEYEPSFAPEGKTVLQTNVCLFDDDYHFFKKLSREEYQELKQEYVKVITDRIIKNFPSLESHIEVLDAFSPLTYERYMGAYHGAYMSFTNLIGEKSFRNNGIIKGAKNLYIASQWINSPGGLPSAVSVGKFVIQRITNDFS